VSDYFSIQDIGGTDLARHYPDRGLISESNWYNAILKVETKLDRWWKWLESFVRGNQAFGAVLSANRDGLRILVSMDKFTAFVPWSEASVSAKRMSQVTVIRLRPAAVPSLTLVFHLNSDAADDLFRHVAGALPLRLPP
jgi:hypothetical protein